MSDDEKHLRELSYELVTVLKAAQAILQAEGYKRVAVIARRMVRKAERYLSPQAAAQLGAKRKP